VSVQLGISPNSETVWTSTDFLMKLGGVF
jgi:hypothetical protein